MGQNILTKCAYRSALDELPRRNSTQYELRGSTMFELNCVCFAHGPWIMRMPVFRNLVLMRHNSMQFSSRQPAYFLSTLYTTHRQPQSVNNGPKTTVSSNDKKHQLKMPHANNSYNKRRQQHLQQDMPTAVSTRHANNVTTKVAIFHWNHNRCAFWGRLNHTTKVTENFRPPTHLSASPGRALTQPRHAWGH